MCSNKKLKLFKIMEICRVCMRKETNMAQLFDTKSEDDHIMKIQFCTGVLFTKQDILPSKICTKCLEELETAHKFKLQCLNSKEICQNLIDEIKEEPQYNGDILDDSTNLNNGATKITVNEEDAIKNDETSDNYPEFNNGGDLTDDAGKDFDNEPDIKVEANVLMETKSIRKSKRVRLKTNEESSAVSEDVMITKKTGKVRKVRGPYKGAGKQPRRLAKLKFRKLFCEACNLKFTTKSESDEHKKEFHNEPQLWICEICGKSFAHRSSHHAHMRVHYPPQHACDHCDYKTANKHDLNKHIRVHTGKKSYMCPVCAGAYRTSSNLHAHVRLMHERVRRHACQLCARSFFDRTKLNRHLDSHNDVKRYSCEVCHACFTRRCYWKKHLQKQHDIVVPSCRPGRARTDIVLPPEKEDK